MKSLFVPAVWACCWVMFQAGAVADELRTWTSKAGTSVKGTMVGVDAASATVKLKKEDGSEISVPIAMLSDADIAYAKAKWQEMQIDSAMVPGGAADAPAVPAVPAGEAAPAVVTAPAAPSGAPAPPRPELVVTPAAKFKAPAAADYLKVVPRTRPRMIHGGPGWEYLKGQIKTDATAGVLFERMKQGAEKVLEAPELTRIYGEQRGRNTPGGKAINRLALLGALQFLDEDPRWLDRAVRDLVALCDPSNFSDWYPDQPNVTTDFVIAACLGFDWLQKGMNKQQIEKVRGCILNQGITPLLEFLGKQAEKKELEASGPDAVTFGAASALIFAALTMHDEDGTAAKKAVGAAAKVFGNGMLKFAPGGVWPEGPDEGDVILDYAVLVLQSLRACAGNDLGLSTLEGFVRAGDARLHLMSPIGQTFNFGDAQGTNLVAGWAGSWLSGVHGNPGQPAVTAPAAPGPDSYGFGATGYLLYHNAHAAGYGTAEGVDAVFPGAEVATLRSAWNDKNAWYVGIKGGDNGRLHAQLDLGTFVLDAAGQRWAVELGAEEDRAPGMGNPLDRARRYTNYRQGSLGQNVLVSGSGNQPLDARAALAGFHSTPERGSVLVDLKGPFNKEAKDYLRGAMLVRGERPYVVIQDDVGLKSTQTLTWSMHTRAKVEVDGKSAILTQANQTLTAVILSPEGAVFTTEEAPEQVTPLKSLKGVNVLKTVLSGVKGDQRLAVAFYMGDAAPQIPVVPVADWLPKR